MRSEVIMEIMHEITRMPLGVHYKQLLRTGDAITWRDVIHMSRNGSNSYSVIYNLYHGARAEDAARRKRSHRAVRSQIAQFNGELNSRVATQSTTLFNISIIAH